ncbi:hypothetical protein AB1H94_17780 [Pseudomonas fulva]|uniref:hypothetical protein n=1 Tax=Pseudomonas fulva TaxID=47880 RepID=UPI002DB8A80B|nr:hypothetical protein [Pseudomonas fulva]MEC4022131.1 hypothetical protein [Pseudomonas fulva]
MPIITVTTIVTTRFDVPEGLSIELIRHQAMPTLSEEEDGTDSVLHLQDAALNQVYLGDAASVGQSVEHSIKEGIH